MKTKQEFLDTYDFEKILNVVSALDIKYFDSNMYYMVPTIDFLKYRFSCLFDNFDLYKSNVASDGLFQLSKNTDDNFELKYIIEAVTCTNIKSLFGSIDFEKIYKVMILNDIKWTNDKGVSYMPDIKEVEEYAYRLIMNAFLTNGTVDKTCNNFNVLKFIDCNNQTQYHLSYLI